nr:unnamed protein product [Spirometra erinaceieuropaei]
MILSEYGRQVLPHFLSLVLHGSEDSIMVMPPGSRSIFAPI